MAPLHSLALRYGIELEYENAAGERVAVPDATVARILAAMGVEARTAAETEAALQRLEAEDWERPLPTVVVDRSGGADVTLAIVVPAGLAHLSIELDLEGAVVRHEEAMPDVLPEIGRTERGGRLLVRRRLVLADLPLGYHRLHIPELEARTTLIVTPRRCWLPDRIEAGGRTWGLSVQVPLLRSPGNWGIGDFADLTRLAATAGGMGADVIGLSPLHALFLDDPEAASPYSPASRLLLNPLHVASNDVFGAARAQDHLKSAAVLADVEAARATEEVDYAAVARLKLEAFRRLYVAFRRGDGFRDACLFLALRRHFAEADPPRPDWRDWPEDFHGPTADGTRRFAVDHPDAVEFQAWLQWVADLQLGSAAEAARDAGMTIGLYRDLAVGADRAGAETWADPDAVVRGATVGAPPDLFMPLGQDWGLPPFNPAALRRTAYAGFVELLRANMRHAGGLRIDHVMGLKHLWWVPEGCPPSEGAYVAYPMEDMVGILALESCRHRCLVVGEDLGTVPPGFRDAMADAGILSYRVLFFEQDFDTGRFVAPKDYPPLALAVAGSHDLPTLAGWWRGTDIDLKHRLGLYPDDAEADAQRCRRAVERKNLIALMREDGFLEPEAGPDEADFVDAAHAVLAATGSALTLAQFDDLTDETIQVNVPGTTDENPNWRRKYRLPLDEAFADPRAEAALRTLAARKARDPSAP